MKIVNSNQAELILEQLPVESIQLDQHLTIISWSKEANRYTNLPLVAGASALEYFSELIGSEEYLEDIRLREATQLQITKINRLVNGELTYYNVAVAPIWLTERQEDGLVCFLSDVTETCRLEQSLTQRRNELTVLSSKLEEQNQRLLELDQFKSALLAITAHELRSPLGVSYSFLNLLKEDLGNSLSPEQSLYLDRASTNISRMLNLTNDLLDLERIENGNMELNLVSFNLLRLVQSVVGNFQVEMQQRKLEVVFEGDLAQDYRVKADMERIEQVLTNFISNAIKYNTPGTQIKLRVEMSDEFVVANITDNGIGITEADQKKLFQRFFRASNANSKGATGNGLGLSIVRAIIERHGGRVWVNSQIGTGSTFSFSLPRFYNA